MSRRNMVVSLIGRPNVGKSSLFNVLMKKQTKALTFDRPGVTRDRHYGIAKFEDLANEEEQDIIMVDTGGFYPSRIDDQNGNQAENQNNRFFNIMTDHAEMAIDESDLVLFIVDVREGVLPFDQTIADYIRSKKKPFWLIVNKFDTEKQRGLEAEFYSLGVDEFLVTSAAHGLGLQELRERLHQKAADFNKDVDGASQLTKGVTPRENVVSRVALIGAPNAGKSTLLNNLIGAQRALVSDIPGTTVDPIEGYFDMYFGAKAKELDETTQFSKDDQVLVKKYEDWRKNNPDFFDRVSESYDLEEDIVRYEDEFEEFEGEISLDGADQRIYDQVFQETDTDANEEAEIEAVEESPVEEGSFWRSVHLVDTAGIRRKAQIHDFVETQSVYRSLRCITESDIVLFLVDSTKGIGHQDRRLLDIALEKGKSVVVCLNKVDLLKDKLKTDQDRKKWIQDLRIDIPWLEFCDLIPISAKYNKGMKALKNSLIKTIFIRRRNIPTGELNRAIFGLIEHHPVVVKKAGGRRLKVKYSSMLKSNPPTFLLFTNKSKGIPENYKRYLKNGIRRNFEMDNTPIHIIFRTGSDLEKRMKKVKLRT